MEYSRPIGPTSYPSDIANQASKYHPEPGNNIHRFCLPFLSVTLWLRKYIYMDAISPKFHYFPLTQAYHCRRFLPLHERLKVGGEIRLVPNCPTRLFSKNHNGVTVYLLNSLLSGISSYGYVKGILGVLGYTNFYANIGLARFKTVSVFLRSACTPITTTGSNPSEAPPSTGYRTWRSGANELHPVININCLWFSMKARHY